MNDISTQGAALPLFDPRRPGLLGEPYRVFAEYRSHDPVHWSGCPSGRRGGRWFVFDYRSAVTVLTDKSFCRQPVTTHGACPTSQASPASPLAEPPEPSSAPAPCGAFATMIANQMVFQDPPRHTRLRSAVNPAFTFAALRALRPRIEQRVHELLEPLAKRESVDLIREFALPLPLDVIADVLGVDVGERMKLREWSASMRDAIDRPRWGSDALVRAEAATLGFREYFEAAWLRHRTEPGEGLLSALFSLEGLEAGLSKEEAFSMLIILVSAGHETTTNLIGSGMHLLARHPRELQRLREEPAFIPTAIEEILRCESPVQMAARNVAKEIQLGSRQLAPGQKVEVLIGSANRDPAVFASPECFDVARKPNPHLAFGMGIHHCIGASLARLVGSIALPALLDRVRVQEFAPDTKPWMASVGFRGLTHLPCTVC